MHPTKLENPSPNSTADEFGKDGDIILGSLDGIEFKVHSLFLSHASPVIAHMFCSGTSQTAVDMAENSEILRLMLKLIYPCSPPPIQTFELLGQGLHMADKYQLEGMKFRLRERLSLKGSPVSVFSDPLRALAFCTVHDLATEAALAASVASKSQEFRQAENLVELAQAMPSIAPVVKMVGMPSARTSILIGVLFQFHRAPMIMSPEGGFKILCSNCDEVYFNKARYGAPEWQARWACWVFRELNARSLSDCSEVFKVEFLKLAMHKGDVPIPDNICKCHYRMYENKRWFETWTAGVRETLATRLEALEPLDAIAE
ncbi:hypothetical protein FRC12_003780 [Ceratobasidium sp. 428]|nr:hypothetical protein FRC12_003780 [Ceratobasidium sp. 428]